MPHDLVSELDWLAARCASLADYLKSARDTLKASRELDRATASIAALTRSAAPVTATVNADGVDRAMSRVSSVPPLAVVVAASVSQRDIALAAVRALSAHAASGAPTAGLSTRSGSSTPDPRGSLAVCGDAVGAVVNPRSRQLGS